MTVLFRITDKRQQRVFNPADGELMINSYFDILQTEVPVSQDAGTFVFTLW
jgi:hypothetical protein